MTEWKYIAFSEMLVDQSISYGVVQPGSHQEIDSVPIIRVNNIKNGSIDTHDLLKVSRGIEEKYKRTRLVGGELLITVVGSIGECAIVPLHLKGMNVARAISVARIKPQYDTRFVKYLFKTEDVKYQLYGNTNDTVQPTLNLSLLKQLRLPVPPLPEQQSIAEVLSSLDDKIDLLHRNNKTLEQLAETLFRQWFVEEANNTQTITLEDIAKFSSGKPRPEENTGDNIPIYGGNGVLGYTGNHNTEGNTIIVGRVGAYCGSIYYENRPIWVSDNALIVKPRDPEFIYYLLYLLKSFDLNTYAEGSSHPLLTQGLLKSLEFTSPSKENVVKYYYQVSDLINKVFTNNSQIGNLEKLRDTLLPKLMSGEVSVEI